MLLVFQSASELPTLFEHQQHNTTFPFLWYKTPADEMTVGEQSGIQDDQRDRPSNVVHSIVINSEESNTEEDESEDDVLCNLLARRSNNVSCDIFRGIQDDKKDGSSDVVHSIVIDSEESNTKVEEWEDDVLCSLLARRSNNVGCDMFRGIQDDQKDGSSNVVHSIVIDSEGSNTKEDEWEDDVLCSVIARPSTNVGHDMFRGSYEVERVHEAKVTECKYNSNTCDQVISKPYICGVCNKTFAKSNYLQMHKRTHTSHKPYYMHNKSLTMHRNLNRSKCIQSVIKLSASNKEYICDICNKIFNYMCNLNRHKRIHTGEKPYVCDICSKAFNQSSHLNTHKFTHMLRDACEVETVNQVITKPYVCVECNKAFAKSSYHQIHKRIHTMCHKTVGSLSRRNCIHSINKLRKHDKEYICDICNKTFSHVSNLYSHKRTHTPV